MNSTTHLFSWILYAVQQSPNESSEFYYFDTTNQEFFSVLTLDLFLFDQKLNPIEGISLYYTYEELIQLKDRLKRIKQKKRSIIPLPRIGIQADQEELIKTVTDFLQQNTIDIQKITLSEPLQKEPLSKEKRKFPNLKTAKKWWKIWK